MVGEVLGQGKWLLVESIERLKLREDGKRAMTSSEQKDRQRPLDNLPEIDE
ncbi:hypothetical protein PPACK8108_LOCUS13126 [Phakopsora pachyrhizi]|uniref:Uncharacterized protein n=1 Tax=Phakopsora pachyrhizi TaxID=170000 RepID=A0AAV0B578_PHAPC|nr:hypothetical protein PPACK8108_LOCUS13126 [Phakopsora pachyrhizi]